MGIRITGNDFLLSSIDKSQKDAESSMERLSTGSRFARNEPMPAERARSDSLTAKMRDLSVYKRNASDGMSLTEYADSALSQLTNMNIRMKELVTQSTNASLSDKERQFLFVEYQSLYDEFDRQASTANYNGESLLNYQRGGRKEIDFRVGQATLVHGDDVNVIRLENLDEVRARPKDIGLIDAKDLLSQEDGVTMSDVNDNFNANSINDLGATFDKASEILMEYRAKFGAATTRLNKAMVSMDSAFENIAAANSRISDVDYATEITNLTKAHILLQAGTSLLSQKQQMEGQVILSLIKNSDK